MKNSRQLLALSLATFSLLTIPSETLAAPPHTGIQGQAFLYISYGMGVEVAPGVWVAPPSVQLPVATSFTLFAAHSGREIARVTTDANGSYSLSAQPGTYVLAPDTFTIQFGCSVSRDPIEVTVKPREFTVANVFYFHEGPCSVVGTEP